MMNQPISVLSEFVSNYCSGLKHGMFYSTGEELVKRNSYEDNLVPEVQNGDDLTEWRKTSHPGNDQCGQSSVSDSDNWVMSTTWDMHLSATGEEGCRLEL